MQEVKYPDITVQLSGLDGNVFVLIGAAKSALQRAGVPSKEVKHFVDEAFAQCSYDHIIQHIMRTMSVT